MSKVPNKTFADLVAKAAIDNYPGRQPSDASERKAFKAGAKWAADLLEDALISKEEQVEPRATNKRKIVSLEIKAAQLAEKLKVLNLNRLNHMDEIMKLVESLDKLHEQIEAIKNYK